MEMAEVPSGSGTKTRPAVIRNRRYLGTEKKRLLSEVEGEKYASLVQILGRVCVPQ